MRQFGDILRVDLVDTYGDLSLKTMKLFATLPGKIDADFYFKVHLQTVQRSMTSRLVMSMPLPQRGLCILSS